MDAWPEKLTRAVGSPASLVAHTVVFALALLAIVFGAERDTVMLVLTTAVSLEAIYLAIFIQMAVNRQAAALAKVEEDIDEIQEDVEDIGEDVEEIQEDVEEIQEDVEEIHDDVEEMQEEEIVPVASGENEVARLRAALRQALDEVERLDAQRR